jgi:predicted secreted protein
MRSFISYALLSVLFLTVPLSAQAQVEDVILAMPDGQAILNISATERREVEQDLLVATLSYKVVNKDPRIVQDEINKKMKKALSTSKKETDIKVSTGSYQVYERNEQRTKETKWHGSQSLTLKSKNSEEILKLVGKLQDMGLTSNGLNYTLSPETAVEVQDSLMEAALKQLQTRANRAAKALGKSTAELREVNVNSGNAPYRPMHQSRGMMMMSADSMEMAAPVASAGESTITLTVNARVILKP